MCGPIRRKASSFEEYWLASKAWERRGLPIGPARSLVNNGFLSLDDLHGGARSGAGNYPEGRPKELGSAYGLMGRELPGGARQRDQPKRKLGVRHGLGETQRSAN
jgi:hypothetical protein